MGPIGCPETSVKIAITRRVNPAQRSSHLICALL